MLDVSSLRRTSVNLGESVNLPLKIAATPKHREGLPRRKGPLRCRQLRVGEPENMECGLSGPLRQGVARLGEPLRLGGGGLCLGVHATT